MNIVRIAIIPAAAFVLTAFYIQPASAQTLRALYVFPNDGMSYNPNPQTGVIVAPSGNLFGTTGYGGSDGKGSIYELVRPAAGQTDWTENILHSFSGPDGVFPNGPLFIGNEGKLLGTAGGGGAYGQGAIFDLIPPGEGATGWTQNVLYSFQGSSESPIGSVLRLGENRYGVTESGGTNGCGSVYEASAATATHPSGSVTTIYKFDCGQSGSEPFAGVIADATGNLYGTTYLDGSGGGTVYELSPPTSPGHAWTETTLYSFMNGADGGSPASSVTFGSDGSLYGTTQSGGGTFSAGVIFKLTPPISGAGPWTETVLYTFTGGEDGRTSISALVPDGAQGFYGADQYGGDPYCECGAVFHVQPPAGGGNDWTLVWVHSFSGGNDGARPVGNLLKVDGVLYGVTTGSGGNPATVYSIVP